jgi:transposase
MQAQSGNINHVEGFKKIVKSHVSSLKVAQQCRYLAADAALYVKETIVDLDALGQLFITRVPQKLKEAKTLIQSANFLIFASICESYQGVWHSSHYGDVEQKWLLVRSEQATKREHHTLNSRMLKQAERSRKAFKQLCQQAFARRTDAFAAIDQWQEKQATLAVEATVLEVPVYEGKGRPGKNQQAVEKGFRSLKSPDFLTSAFYLKKPERLEALLRVMTTCLMVYAALEHTIREQLKVQDEYFPDMKKKPTQTPTARWVFQCFAGIDLLTINEQQTLLLNIKDRQAIIIKVLGINYQRIYS